MNAKFKNIEFDSVRHTQDFREDANTFFEVPLTSAMNPEAAFNKQFISLFNPVQVYAVGKQMIDNCLIYQIIKPEIFKLTNPMLQMLFAPINQVDGVGDYLVKVHNVRAYVEVNGEFGEIVKLDKSKSIIPLHVGGRDGALSWEQLVEAVNLYGVENIILDNEILNYKNIHGYEIISFN